MEELLKKLRHLLREIREERDCGFLDLPRCENAAREINREALKLIAEGHSRPISLARFSLRAAEAIKEEWLVGEAAKKSPAWVAQILLSPEDVCPNCGRDEHQHSNGCSFVQDWVNEVAATTESTDAEGWPQKQTICQDCHELKLCTFGPCALESDLNNDFTPYWLCQECRRVA